MSNMASRKGKLDSFFYLYSCCKSVNSVYTRKSHVYCSVPMFALFQLFLKVHTPSFRTSINVDLNMVSLILNKQLPTTWRRKGLIILMKKKKEERTVWKENKQGNFLARKQDKTIELCVVYDAFKNGFWTYCWRHRGFCRRYHFDSFSWEVLL